MMNYLNQKQNKLTTNPTSGNENVDVKKALGNQKNFLEFSISNSRTFSLL